MTGTDTFGYSGLLPERVLCVQKQSSPYLRDRSIDCLVAIIGHGIGAKDRRRSIEPNGNTIAARYRRDVTSIIRMVMAPITSCPTSNWLMAESIIENIPSNFIKWVCFGRPMLWHYSMLQSGMLHLKDWLGTLRMAKIRGKCASGSASIASNAAGLSSRRIRPAPSFVISIAGRLILGAVEGVEGWRIPPPDEMRRGGIVL